jgi:protein SCO1/2
MLNMSRTKLKFGNLTLWLLIVFMMAALAAIVIRMAQKSRAILPEYGKVPEFRLEHYKGGHFSESDLRGKLFVVDFIFTRCPSACPIMSAKMSKLYQLYRHSNKVKFVSITVDPDHDTPETLQRYALEHNITDDRWIFLRGTIKDVVALSEKGFMLPADNLPMGHSVKFVLVDQNGMIRGYFNALEDSSIELLKIKIKELARKLV